MEDKADLGKLGKGLLPSQRCNRADEAHPLGM